MTADALRALVGDFCPIGADAAAGSAPLAAAAFVSTTAGAAFGVAGLAICAFFATAGLAICTFFATAAGADFFAAGLVRDFFALERNFFALEPWDSVSSSSDSPSSFGSCEDEHSLEERSSGVRILNGLIPAPHKRLKIVYSDLAI